VANSISNGTVSVLKNLGNGTFTAAVSYAAGSYPRSVAVGDVDGDSDLDLVVATYNSGTVSVLRNQGDGTLAAAVSYAPPPTPPLPWRWGPWTGTASSTSPPPTSAPAR